MTPIFQLKQLGGWRFHLLRCRRLWEGQVWWGNRHLGLALAALCFTYLSGVQEEGGVKVRGEDQSHSS